MKILHVLDHSIPLHSGYTFRTRSILKQQHARGWQTLQVTSPKQGNKKASIDEVDGLTFYRTALPNGLASRLPAINQLALIRPLAKRIGDAIEAFKPDIIHAHSPALNGLAAIRAGKKHGIPVVYEIRAFWEDAAVDHGTCKEGDLRYKMTRMLENYVIRHADKVTCICEGLRSDLIKRGVPKDKIIVIPNAVNVEQFSLITAKDAALEAELGLTDKKVLGFLGSFYGYEGLELLVAALPLIKQQTPNVALLLVGGGPQEDSLRAQITRMGLDKDVIMTGRVPHGEIGRYYSLVDLLVYPRKSMRLTELVTPLKPLEAMAQGKLVLASDVGGHKELIEEGKTGWLFEAGSVDALAHEASTILARTEQWHSVVKQGRHYVEQVRNWQNSVAHYEPLYVQLGR